MAIKIPPILKIQEALDVPFEPLRNPGFGGVPSDVISEDVQNAIEEIANRVSNIKLITHFRNAAGYEIETYNEGAGTHIESAPLVVCDNDGNVVSGSY